MKSFFAPCISASEFKGFWIEPVTEFVIQEYVTAEDGRYHIGRILKANPGSVHRAYPTWQPWKTEGAYGPCMFSFDFKYSIPALIPGQWVSLLTLSKNGGDGAWDVVGLNIDGSGNLFLYHIPLHNQMVYTRLGRVYAEQNTWHHLDVIVDFRPLGSVTVLHNGAVCLYAPVEGGDGRLYQAHAGMYADGSIASGWIANKNIRIRELEIESAAN